MVSNTASNDVAPVLLSFTSSLATEILRVLVSCWVNAIAGNTTSSSWNVERFPVQL